MRGQTQGTIVTSNVVFTARNSGQVSGYVAAVNTAPAAILAASTDPTIQVMSRPPAGSLWRTILDLAAIVVFGGHGIDRPSCKCCRLSAPCTSDWCTAQWIAVGKEVLTTRTSAQALASSVAATTSTQSAVNTASTNPLTVNPGLPPAHIVPHSPPPPPPQTVRHSPHCQFWIRRCTESAQRLGFTPNCAVGWFARSSTRAQLYQPEVIRPVNSTCTRPMTSSPLTPAALLYGAGTRACTQPAARDTGADADTNVHTDVDPHLHTRSDAAASAQRRKCRREAGAVRLCCPE